MTDKTQQRAPHLDMQRFAIGDLSAYPGNARRSNVELIKESLKANGQYRPIVMQKSTRYVIAGNHLVEAARELGWSELDVVVLDVDDPAARRILLADNRTADAGTYDNEALLALLQDMDGDFNGTGFTDDDMDTLMANLGQFEAAEFHAPDTDAHYNETEEEQAQRTERLAAGSKLAEKGLSETVLILGVSERNELLDMLEDLRGRWGEELSNGQIVYEAVKRAVGTGS